MSCRATPRSIAYCRDAGSREPKISRHTRPTADATRMQYSIEVIEGLVPARPEIHLDAFDERLEGLPRQAESRHERRERAALPRLRRPPSKQAASSRRQRAISAAADAVRRARLAATNLVHRIVHGAAEVPYGDDRVALGRRQHQERVVEAGVAGHGSFAGQRQSTASRIRPGMSRFPIVGRWLKTSKSARSMLVENPRAAQPREPEFPAEAPADTVADAPSGGKELARAPNHVAHHAAPLGRHPAGGQVLFTRAGGTPIVAGT